MLRLGSTHESRMTPPASASTAQDIDDLADTESDRRLYEFCILYPYPYSPKEEQELIKSLEEIFREAGGKVVMKDLWGRRGLAYTIGVYTEGNFAVYYVELDPPRIKEIDQTLRIHKGVLRSIIVKPPKHYKMQSYAEKFQAWQEDRKLEEERAVREREERLQRQVVEKAKRSTRAAKKAEAPAEVKPAMTEEALTKELEKLISAEDLKI